MQAFSDFQVPHFVGKTLHLATESRLFIALALLAAMFLSLLIWDCYKEWQIKRDIRHHRQRNLPKSASHQLNAKTPKH